MSTFSTTNYMDIDLGDFTMDELVNELSSRGESMKRDISEFEDDEILSCIRSRGYYICDNLADLTQTEIQLLLSMFVSDYKIGSEQYFLYEKLIKAKEHVKI